MSRLSRGTGRGLRSRLAAATILLAGIGSVIGYAAISATINGEPSTSPFQGFVALLQAAGSFSPDQVKLAAAPLAPGGPGQHPALEYSVAVCGSQPFRGMLLIGGDARLSHLQVDGGLSGRTAGQTRAESFPDLSFVDEGTGAPLDLGPVQAIPLAISHPGKCAAAFSPQQSPPPPFFGLAQIVTGQAAAPVQRQWRLGWWAGPRTSQSWPLIGDLPGISTHDLGEFQARKGLHGSWTLFMRQYTAVSAGSLQGRASVDEARPQPDSSTGLDWDSAQPLAPTAVVTNTTSLSSWQNWLVAAGIFLGISGSLLASLLYEWARPSRAPAPQVPRPVQPADPGRHAEPGSNWVATFGALAVLVWLVASGRRRS